jgi:hypothetical protein
MNSPSRSQPSADAGTHIPRSPQAQCDLCEGVMTIPSYCIINGEIRGLLTCEACIEDCLQGEVR